MIKLTPERAWEIWVAESIEERTTREFVVGYASAIEAEVLRLNGTENEALRRLLCSVYSGGMAYTDDGEAQDSREHPSIDFLRDSIEVIQSKMRQRVLSKMAPRATGCPETMDDTARFAADELPAILKKQAG